MLMLSSYHSAEIIETKRHYETGTTRETKCYIWLQFRDAVDKTDMILNSINTVWKIVKGYKKFFFHILVPSVYNAYVLI
jgi:hypothetical protein